MSRAPSRYGAVQREQVLRTVTARGVPGLSLNKIEKVLVGFAPWLVVKLTSSRAEGSWNKLPDSIKRWEASYQKRVVVVISSKSYGAPDRARVLMDLDTFAEMAADLAATMPDKWLKRKGNE